MWITVVVNGEEGVAEGGVDIFGCGAMCVCVCVQFGSLGRVDGVAVGEVEARLRKRSGFGGGMVVWKNLK